MIVKAAFVSSICVLAAAQAQDALPQINAAYAFKDLTVSGLLLAAVVYLYRELGRERKKSEEVAGSAKEFIEKASREQTEALGQVANALISLEASSREQIDIHRTHIKAIVDAALPALRK